MNWTGSWKSAVARPWKRKFLGFTFSLRRGHKIKVSEAALEKLKQTVRKLCRRTRGHSITQIIAELRKSLLGWKAYFGIAEIKESAARCGEMDSTEVTVLFVEAVGEVGLPKAQATRSQTPIGLEYG